ncbi:hypothetical protein Q3G72_020595 [Acer saccharum]|nr:hypothetical protein Q3G72_020595 [Acer saccharum]
MPFFHIEVKGGQTVTSKQTKKVLAKVPCKTLMTKFLIKDESGTLYDDDKDKRAKDYLEWVAEGMGIRRHMP